MNAVEDILSQMPRANILAGDVATRKVKKFAE